MINRQRLEFLKGKAKTAFEKANNNMQRMGGRRAEVEALVKTSKVAVEKRTYMTRSQELLQKEISAMGKARELMGWVKCYDALIKTVDNMHAGKDPGDGFTGREGDQDYEAEQAAQEAAEAEAQEQTEAELSVSVTES